MKRRHTEVHPFAIPLLAGIAAAVLGLLYWLFGIGKAGLDWAVAIGLFYAAVVVITFAVAGVVWVVARLFGRRD